MTALQAILRICIVLVAIAAAGAFTPSWSTLALPGCQHKRTGRHCNLAPPPTALKMVMGGAMETPAFTQPARIMVNSATTFSQWTQFEEGQQAPSSPLTQGVMDYASPDSTTASSSTSMLVSLQERKIPTKEEIEAKKRNFNLIFWGGGFVAPFLATIFYFGFRFWEK